MISERLVENKRTRRKPVSLQDYVFSIFRQMAKVKTTPRKHPVPTFSCAKCKEEIEDEKTFKYHVKKCVGGEIGCDVLQTTFAKQAYYKQHMQRKHADPEKGKSEAVTTSKMEEKDKIDDDWDLDPDIELLDYEDPDVMIETLEKILRKDQRDNTKRRFTDMTSEQKAHSSYSSIHSKT